MQDESVPENAVSIAHDGATSRRITPSQRIELEALRENLHEERVTTKGINAETSSVLKKVEMALATGSLREVITADSDDAWGGVDYGIKYGDAWTALGGAGKRDLNRNRQKISQQIAFSLFKKHPIAYRIVSDITDYVGNGRAWSYMAKDSRVQEVLDEFWNHPTNDFKRKLDPRVEQLLIFGEQIWPVGINDQSGIIQLGYIDPANVLEVRQQAGNAEILDSVVIVERNVNGIVENKKHDIIRQMPNKTWRIAKENVFFFTYDKPSNATRGSGILLSLLDYLDIYDQALFTIAERQALLNSHIWDVELSGMSETEIQKWVASQPDQPKPGTMRAHNERVKWNVVSPSLAAEDQDTTIRMILQAVMAGAGTPEHWLGRSTDTNRATARSMSYPVQRRLRGIQSKIMGMIEKMFDAQIYLSSEKGRLNGVTDKSYTVLPPDIGIEDPHEAASATIKMAQALTIAQDQGYISPSTGKKIFQQMLDSFGFRTMSEVDDMESEIPSLPKRVYDEIAAGG